MTQRHFFQTGGSLEEYRQAYEERWAEVVKRAEEPADLRGFFVVQIKITQQARELEVLCDQSSMVLEQVEPALLNVLREYLAVKEGRAPASGKLDG